MAGNSTSTMRAAFKAPTTPPRYLAEAITNYQSALTVALAVIDPAGDGDTPEYLTAWDAEMEAGRAFVACQCATANEITTKIQTLLEHVPLRETVLAEPHQVIRLLESFILPTDRAIKAYSDAAAFAATISDDDEDAWKAAQDKVWDRASDIIDAPCHSLAEVQRKFLFIRDNRAVSDCLTMGDGAVMDLVRSIAGEA